jgi:hypothetical protein
VSIEGVWLKYFLLLKDMLSTANNAVRLTKESWKHKAKRKSWRTTAHKVFQKFLEFGNECGAWVKLAKIERQLTSPPKSSHLHISSLLPPLKASVCVYVYKSCMGRANASVAAGRIRREHVSILHP